MFDHNSQQPFEELDEELTAYADFVRQHFHEKFFKRVQHYQLELTKLQTELNIENIRLGRAMPINDREVERRALAPSRLVI